MADDYYNLPEKLPLFVSGHEGDLPDEPAIAEWHERKIDTVREVLKEHGVAPPGLIFLGPDPSGEYGYIEGFLDLRPLHLVAEPERVLFEIAPTFLRDAEAFACFVVREGWTAEIDAKEYPEGFTSPTDVQDVPGALEVVTCLCESRTTSRMRMFPIVRNDVTTLGDEIDDIGDDASGPVVTFLHQPAPGEVPN